MKVSEQLVSSSMDLIESFYDHPFVAGMTDGTLDHEKFQYYMIQDYLYLFDYAKVFALGVAKSDEVYAMRTFSEYLYSILHGEMEIHRGYMKRLGISEEAALQTPMAMANRSYTAYMLKCAYQGAAAESVVSILSCSVSYEYIGKEMVRRNPESVNDPFFGDWIKGYSSPDYAQENVRLEELTDYLTKDSSPAQVEKLRQIFRNCTLYEKGFWDMGWTMAR